SRLCHEPRIGATVLEQMISPLLSSGRLQWLREHEPVAVDRVGNRVTAVTVRDLRADVQVRLSAPLIVDATERGDLLELGDVEHVIGAEAHSEFGELHAPEQADPLDQQAVTWCCALEWHRVMMSWCRSRNCTTDSLQWFRTSGPVRSSRSTTFPRSPSRTVPGRSSMVIPPIWNDSGAQQTCGISVGSARGDTSCQRHRAERSRW